MKKISTELKAGLATILILVLFYWGYNFMKGQNLLNGSLKSYYTVYNNINGLTVASPVSINGYTVGKVIDIAFIKNGGKNNGKLLVEFIIEEDVEFSKNSIAKIFSSSLMGGKSLAIIPREGKENAQPGDYLKGEIESDLLSSFGEKLNPLQSKIEGAIVNVDSVAHHLNQLLNEKMISDIHSSLANLSAALGSLKTSSEEIEKTVVGNQNKLESTINNVAESTKNLKIVSDSLAQIRLLQISKKLNSTVTNLDKITKGIDNGKGTLGLLAKDDALYRNLQGASSELEQLLREIKEHPKRFVHFSLFGKADKEFESKEK